MLQCYKCDGVKGQDLPCDGASGKGKEVVKHANFAMCRWLVLGKHNDSRKKQSLHTLCDLKIPHPSFVFLKVDCDDKCGLLLESRLPLDKHGNVVGGEYR